MESEMENREIEQESNTPFTEDSESYLSKFSGEEVDEAVEKVLNIQGDSPLATKEDITNLENNFNNKINNLNTRTEELEQFKNTIMDSDKQNGDVLTWRDGKLTWQNPPSSEPTLNVSGDAEMREVLENSFNNGKMVQFNGDSTTGRFENGIVYEVGRIFDKEGTKEE